MRKLAFLFLSLFAFCTASAQVTTSSMSGRVADTDGQPIIGATIVAVHTPTGTQYATASTRNGQFNLGGMRVGGPYDVEVSFIGCNTEKIEGIYLTIGEEATLDFVLREDSQSIGEVVVVGKANPVFNANRTGAQEVVTLEMMEKLPTTSRSLDEFVKLTPMSSGKNFAGTSYRFNNVTVDGASFNNSFGLSSALGAQGTEPISLESIEQVQVMIAPYDVRNGGFTGGGINSVTKSGTNEWHASAYMYTKSPELQGHRVRDYVGQVSEFSNRQYGVSLSGPIVKNKLFFFVNGELDRQDEPISNRLADSRVSAADLDDLAKFLGDQFNYNPGGYDLSKTETRADRLTARIDWNINDRNTFSLKYYYLKSYNTNAPSTSGAPANGRGPNAYAMPFSSSYYRTNNNFNIVMADWNSTINDHMSNTLKVGYSRLRDYRDMDGGFFPQVDILKDGSSYTVFGTEANSYNNQLDTDIFQIQDNFTMNYGRHQITVGTQSDYRTFKNGFAQNYPGSWVFSSIDDFKFNVLAAKDYMASHGNMNGFDIRTYDPAKWGLNPVNGGLANSAGTGQLRRVLGQRPRYQLRHQPGCLLRRIRRPRRTGSGQSRSLLKQHCPRLGTGGCVAHPPDPRPRREPQHPVRSGLHREPAAGEVHCPGRHQQDPRPRHDGALRHRCTGRCRPRRPAHPLGAAAVHLPSGIRRGKAEPHGQYLAPVPVHGHL